MFVFIWAWYLNWPMQYWAVQELVLFISVIFGGFSAQSIADRLDDAKAEFIITCDGAYRGGKDIPLKAVIDDALIGNQNRKKSNCLYKNKNTCFHDQRKRCVVGR